MTKCEYCGLREPLVFCRVLRSALCVRCDENPPESFIARRHVETATRPRVVQVANPEQVQLQ